MKQLRALRHLGLTGSAGVALTTGLAVYHADSTGEIIISSLIGGGFACGLAIATVLCMASERRRIRDRRAHIRVLATQCALDEDIAERYGRIDEALVQLSTALEDRLANAKNELDLLGAIVSSMEQGILAVDRDEKITLVNGQAQSALNLSEHDLIGRPLWESSRIDDLNQTIRQALDTTDPIHGEATTGELGGRERYLEFRATRVVDDHDTVVGAVVVITDISDLRRLERVRRDFVTNVSHELKTPLTAIRGMIETVIDDGDMPVDIRKRFLKRVMVQGERLSELVGDLLTLSRLESTSDAMDLRELNLTTIIKTSAQQLLPSAHAKRIALRTNLSSEPVLVSGDAEFLRQVADNLIDNAIKYTPNDGQVGVELSQDDGWAQLQVTDTGCGIASSDQARIFERFYRVDKARSRELGSTGLGLSIVKHVVHAHDGIVTVESSPGKGTTFTVRVPLMAASASEQVGEEPSSELDTDANTESPAA